MPSRDVAVLKTDLPATGKGVEVLPVRHEPGGVYVPLPLDNPKREVLIGVAVADFATDYPSGFASFMALAEGEHPYELDCCPPAHEDGTLNAARLLHAIFDHDHEPCLPNSVKVFDGVRTLSVDFGEVWPGRELLVPLTALEDAP